MNIVICTGGSGGHFYPALALAQSLRKRNRLNKIVFIVGGRFAGIKEKDFDYYFVPAIGMSSRLNLRSLGFILVLFFSFIKSVFIIKRIKPDAVIGFGGYASAAAVSAAKLFRTPILLHEQNIVPGKANKMLSKIADRVCVGFEDAKGLFGKRAVFTGNPIRENFLKSAENKENQFRLDENKFTILVMGGSRGAHFINEKFLNILQELKNLRQGDFQVIHITGDKDYEYAMKKYRDANIDSRVFSFLDDINKAYEFSDLIISRAGALTISEICYFGKPAILIPYPFGNAHQKENAYTLAKRGAFIMILQEELTENRLKDEIGSLINDRERIDRMRSSAKALSIPNAADRLADQVEKLIYR